MNKLVTAVTNEILTLQEIQSHLRIDGNYEDYNLIIYRKAAREFTENYIQRAIGTQTIEMIADDFPKQDYIRLSLSPVQSLTSIKYKDKDGIETTMSTSDYILNNDEMPSKVVLAYNKLWPSFTPYPTGAVRIRYICGHTAADLPESIKIAMLLIIGHLYENREWTIAKALEEVPFSVSALLKPYKIRWW